MSDPIQSLLGLGAVKTNPFPPNSRYSNIQTATLTTIDGTQLVYLRRRWVPAPGQFALLYRYTVAQGERLDNLAARLIGDPELFWQLCDSNGAMEPDELTETPGRKLRVTLPQGIPGGLRVIKGVNLTLLVGPGVPVPVPQEALDALTNVEITVASGRASGFQLSFSVSTQSPIQTLLLLAGGSLPPLMRVILIATINGTANVLMDGVVTNVEVSPGIEKSHTTLTVTGEDLTVVMNWIDFSGFPFPAMPAELRVLTILGKYAFLGMIPMVIPSILLDVPIPIQEIPRQQGKDLEYIKSLADRVGYVFYLDPGPLPGMNTAYWGPEIKVGTPQPALNTNMDAFTNVETLTFSIDAEKKRLPILMIQEPITKAPIPIPIPDISPLNPPLGLIPPFPKHIDFISETANLNPIQAAVIGLTKAAQSSDAVFGSGTLDVLRYGQILKARQLVGVRGAGMAFDGLYYVTEVKHKIKRGEYKQDFKLARNGLVSTFSSVPT